MSTLQIPPQNVPFLNRDGSVHPAWRKFLSGLLERTGGYDGDLIQAGNGIAVTAGPTVAIDGADPVTWSAKQTFARATFTPAASVTPASNGDVDIQLTSNTSLTFKAKGSDGTVRSGSVTLA